MASATWVSRTRWRIRSVISELVGCHSELKLARDGVSSCSWGAAGKFENDSPALLILQKCPADPACHNLAIRDHCNGFRMTVMVDKVPCDFLSPLGALRSLILARRTRKAWNKALQPYLPQKIWAVCQAAADWRRCSVRGPLGHRVSFAALGLVVSFEKNWNQRAYISQRQQHGFEIAEYRNGMDRKRLSMMQSSLEGVSRFVFACVVTPSSPKRSVWKVYWKFHALHWFFVCFGFLETCERSWPSGPQAAVRLSQIMN